MTNYVLLDLSEAYSGLRKFAALMAPTAVNQEGIIQVIVNTFSNHLCDDECDCVSDLFEWLSESTELLDEKDNETDQEEQTRFDDFEEVHSAMISVLFAVQAELIHIDPYIGGHAGWSYIQKRGKHDALLVQNQSECT
jgi:hypothetical protein